MSKEEQFKERGREGIEMTFRTTMGTKKSGAIPKAVEIYEYSGGIKYNLRRSCQ